ncbi:MAG: hypothetical protein Q9167_002209 [Letrouitia subvulpina]
MSQQNGAPEPHLLAPAINEESKPEAEHGQQRFQKSYNRSQRYHPENYPFTSKSWQQRPHSPGLKWHPGYDTPESRKSGRVLLIDYVKASQSKKGMRKVVTQEIKSVDELRKLYSNPRRDCDAVLRVLHVQNAPWATHFLLKKFYIQDRDDLVGTDFGRYVKYKRPERHGGKPFLSGKSWKTTHDPWRAINRTSFGLDYLKPYRTTNTEPQGRRDTTGKMMELNAYDEDDNPMCGWDVYVQRFSVYVQHKEEPSEVPGYPDIENPYDQGAKHRNPHEYFPRLDTLDNGNTIIIFENSCSGSIDDTVISARQQWESRWRRLPFYLAYESHDVSNDDDLALECIKIIVQDIWKSVTETWEHLLELCTLHIDILQDKIYEQPADESRAPELWANSSLWLKMERLVAIHTEVVKEMQSNLREITSEPMAEDNWLESSLNDMDRISSFDPSIKWYFIAVVPLMVVVLILWYIFKYTLASARQTPYQRGIYDHFFQEMATTFPLLWTRTGPREFIRPQGMMARLKWTLILYWNRPENTIRPGSSGGDTVEDDLGTWSRCKRLLTKQWTSQLRATAPADASTSSLEAGSGDSFGVIGDGIEGMTEMLVLPVTEHAENSSSGVLKLPLSPGAQVGQKNASPRRPSVERPTSKGSSAGRNSAVLVEEEAFNWLQELGRRSHEFTERLGGQGTSRGENRSDSRRGSSVAFSSPSEAGNRRTSEDKGSGG